VALAMKMPTHQHATCTNRAVRRNGARTGDDERGMGTDPTRARSRALLALLVLASALACAGCDGSFLRKDPTTNSGRVLGQRAWVVLTTDGGRRLVTRRSVRIQHGDTALDMLAQVGDVRFAPDGTIAQVNGEGGGALRTFGPEQASWYYRVDGIESLGVKPDRFMVKPGQSIWWDLRRYDTYERLPVAVGLFPEPLWSGWRNARRPVRISYGSGFKKDADYFHDSVFRKLDPDVVSIGGDDGGVGGVGGEAGAGDNEVKTVVAVRPKAANLIIGRWEQLFLDPYLTDINLDSQRYGITTYIAGRTEIVRQDPDMDFPQPLRDAEGLVWAATTDGEPDGTIAFVITGTTDEGVHAAARALRTGQCQFYLACAVDRDGRVIT
ncbi:MAG: hypothetical protein JWM98_2766, partial [Thermoleophilia bacterium]|nr:hypothetical protein [Thermoleophilia bacterium]